MKTRNRTVKAIGSRNDYYISYITSILIGVAVSCATFLRVESIDYNCSVKAPSCVSVAGSQNWWGLSLRDDVWFSGDINWWCWLIFLSGVAILTWVLFSQRWSSRNRVISLVVVELIVFSALLVNVIELLKFNVHWISVGCAQGVVNNAFPTSECPVTVKFGPGLVGLFILVASTFVLLPIVGWASRSSRKPGEAEVVPEVTLDDFKFAANTHVKS
jgi:hypothetical protein